MQSISQLKSSSERGSFFLKVETFRVLYNFDRVFVEDN